jgi:hypothetical protein
LIFLAAIFAVAHTMFTLDPNPTFTATVQVPQPGSDATQPLTLVFKHKGRKALDAWIKTSTGRSDLEFLAEVVQGWQDVVAANGEPVAYGPQAFESLLDEHRHAGKAIYDTYMRELLEERTKN